MLGRRERCIREIGEVYEEGGEEGGEEGEKVGEREEGGYHCSPAGESHSYRGCSLGRSREATPASRWAAGRTAPVAVETSRDRITSSSQVIQTTLGQNVTN